MATDLVSALAQLLTNPYGSYCCCIQIASGSWISEPELRFPELQTVNLTEFDAEIKSENEVGVSRN